MQDSTTKKFEGFHRLRLTTTVSVGTLLLLVSSVPLSFAQKSAEKTFPSAEQAGHALFVAVRSNDEQALTQILGAGKELVSSDDETGDKLDREQFAKKYEEMHRLVREPDGSTVLYIGAENWPFPIPLMSKAGTWYFDSDAGTQEIVFRRIGGNEATAIETCHALVLAKGRRETAAVDNDPVNQYAQSLVSIQETNRGNSAVMEGVSSPFHGYSFRLLTGKHRSSAGYAFIAYPVEYRSSGVMTFVVTSDDVVYEKDLGPKTAKLANKVTARRPSSTWRAAESQ